MKRTEAPPDRRADRCVYGRMLSDLHDLWLCMTVADVMLLAVCVSVAVSADDVSALGALGYTVIQDTTYMVDVVGYQLVEVELALGDLGWDVVVAGFQNVSSRPVKLIVIILI